MGWADCSLSRFCTEQNFFAHLGAAGFEVNQPINAPDGGDAQGDVRFLPAHAGYEERSNEVEQHAGEVGKHTEDRHKHMLEPMEAMMFLERHDRD